MKGARGGEGLFAKLSRRRADRTSADPLRECGRFHGWQRFTLLHQKPEGLGVDGRAEVGALRLLAAAASQKFQLFACLDAFGGDAETEGAADVDDGADDRGVPCGHGSVPEEMPVDLDGADRQHLERAER